MSGRNRPVTGYSPMTTAQGSTDLGAIFATAARLHTLDASGLGAGIYASAEFTNPDAKGIRIFSVVANGSGTVTVKLQVKNPYTDGWLDLTGAATAALNNNTGVFLTVYPGITGIADAANTIVNMHLGSTWRAVATVATATETFSVAGDYLL